MAVSFAFLIGCGFFLQAAAGVFWAIPPKLCSVETAGSARGLINALGNLGGFCGPYAVGVLTQHVSAAAGVQPRDHARGGRPARADAAETLRGLTPDTRIRRLADELTETPP